MEEKYGHFDLARDLDRSNPLASRSDGALEPVVSFVLSSLVPPVGAPCPHRPRAVRPAKAGVC